MPIPFYVRYTVITLEVRQLSNADLSPQVSRAESDQGSRVQLQAPRSLLEFRFSDINKADKPKKKCSGSNLCLDTWTVWKSSNGIARANILYLEQAFFPSHLCSTYIDLAFEHTTSGLNVLFMGAESSRTESQPLGATKTVPTEKSCSLLSAIYSVHYTIQ